MSTVIAYQYCGKKSRIKVNLTNDSCDKIGISIFKINAVMEESHTEIPFLEIGLDHLNFSPKTVLLVSNINKPVEYCKFHVHDGDSIEDINTETEMSVLEFKDILDVIGNDLMILGVILKDENMLSDYCPSGELDLMIIRKSTIENNQDTNKPIATLPSQPPIPQVLPGYLPISNQQQKIVGINGQIPYLYPYPCVYQQPPPPQKQQQQQQSMSQPVLLSDNMQRGYFQNGNVFIPNIYYQPPIVKDNNNNNNNNNQQQQVFPPPLPVGIPTFQPPTIPPIIPAPQQQQEQQQPPQQIPVSIQKEEPKAVPPPKPPKSIVEVNTEKSNPEPIAKPLLEPQKVKKIKETKKAESTFQLPQSLFSNSFSYKDIVKKPIMNEKQEEQPKYISPKVKRIILNPEDEETIDESKLENVSLRNPNAKRMLAFPPFRPAYESTIIFREYIDVSFVIMMKNKVCSATLPNLWISYPDKKHISLHSTLIYGMNSFIENQRFKFIFQDENNKDYSFKLPFINNDGEYNTIKDKIYFYNIYDKLDHIISINGNKVIPQSRVLIVHSTDNVLEFTDETDNVQYELLPYRYSQSVSTIPRAILTRNAMNRMAIIEKGIEENIPLLIENKTSSAKTYSVEQVCIIGGIPLIRYNFSPSSNLDELIGTIMIQTVNGKPKISFKFGPFTEAFVDGKVLLLDELSLANKEVLQAIMGILDSHELVVDEVGKGYTKYEMNKNFRIIATQNPAGSVYKRTKLDDTMISRFRYLNYKLFPDIDERELKEILIGFKNIRKRDIDEIIQIHTLASKEHIHYSYTLRDCIRVNTMLKKNVTIKESTQLVYWNNLPRKYEDLNCDDFNNPRRYTSQYVLNDITWFKFYHYMNYAMDAGCHVLLYNQDEFVARKYVNAYINTFYPESRKNVLRCTCDMTSDSLIGTFLISSNNQEPEWKDSPLVSSISKGQLCLLQNIDHVKSNTVERLNSLLEIVPNDGYKHTIRFDERAISPTVEVNPNFRIIATLSLDGIDQFSPALLNRFVLLSLGNKERCATQDRTEERKIKDKKMIDYNLNERFKVKKPVFLDWFYRRNDGWYNKEVYLRDTLDKMLRTLITFRSIILAGHEESGKTVLLNTLFDKAFSPLPRKCLYLAGDSEIDELIGFYTKDGEFHQNVLLNAICNGDIVVVENAETMTKELFEFLETIIDPTTDTFTYLSREYKINYGFKLVMCFTSIGDKAIKLSVPSYCPFYSIPDYDSRNKIRISGFDKKVVDSNIFSLTQLMYLKQICESYTKDYIPFILSLYISYKDESKLEELKNLYPNIANNIQSFINAPVIYDQKKHKLSKSFIEISYNSNIMCNDHWYLECLFRILLTTKGSTPLLIVGSNPFKLKLLQDLCPNNKLIDISRSYDSSHLFGSTVVGNTSELLTSINQISTSNVSPQFSSWKKEWLNESKNGNTHIFFKPGLLLSAYLCEEDIILNHLDLLNESMLPRIHGILDIYSNNNLMKYFTIYEDSIGTFSKYIIDHITRLFATVDDEDYSKITYKERFLPIFCDYPTADEMKKKFPMYNEKTPYPINYYQVADRISQYFCNKFDSLLYVNYIAQDSQTKEDIIREESNPIKESQLLNFFNIDKTRPELNENTINDIFKKSFIERYRSVHSFIEQNSNDNTYYVVPTTVHMITTVLLGLLSSTPIILEGEPGCGKSVTAQYILNTLGIEFQRINFSPNMTIQELFGSFQLNSDTQTQQTHPGTITKTMIEAQKKRIPFGFLFDELNLASTDILEVLTTLIKSSYTKEPFYAPGYGTIPIPDQLYIICTLNPASMTSNRTSLPRSIVKQCLYFNDITYQLIELLFIGKHILTDSRVFKYEKDKIRYGELINQLFECSLKLGKQTGIHFSLRESIKSNEVSKSSQLLKSDIRAALWIVFGCKYNESDTKEIESVLQINSQMDIRLLVMDGKIHFFGPWSIKVPSDNFQFNFNCLTTTELHLAYKLALAYDSSRGIIVYGPSPSGKSFVIRKLAELYKKTLVPIPLTTDSTSDMLIGHCELYIDPITGKTDLKFRNGPLLSAMIDGAWVMIEDVNTASSDILERLNSLCEENPELTVIETDQKPKYSKNSKDLKYRIHQDFRLFFLFSTDNISIIPAPLLSRCIVISAQSISNVMSCQELCYITGNHSQAEYFGEDTNFNFRKVLRYLSNPNEQTYNEEFNQKRVGHHTIVANIKNNKTNSQILKEKLIKNDYNNLAESISNALNESIQNFTSKDIQLFDKWIISNSVSILCYPINLIRATVYNHLGENNTIMNPTYETYNSFKRWQQFKTFNLRPKISYNNYQCPLLIPSCYSHLENYYNINGQSGNLIILYYIIDELPALLSRNEYKKFKDTIMSVVNNIPNLIENNVDIVLLLNRVCSLLTCMDKKIEENKGIKVDQINDTMFKELLKIRNQLNKDVLDYNLRQYEKFEMYEKQYINFFNEISNQRDLANINDRQLREKIANLSEATNILVNIDEKFTLEFKNIFQNTGIDKKLLSSFKSNKPLPELNIQYKKIVDPNTRLYVQLSHLLYFINIIDSKYITSVVIRYFHVFEKLAFNKEYLLRNISKIEEEKEDISNYLQAVMNKLAKNVKITTIVLSVIYPLPFYIHKFVNEEDIINSLAELAKYKFITTKDDNIVQQFVKNKLYKLIFDSYLEKIDTSNYNYIQFKIISQDIIQAAESSNTGFAWNINYMRSLTSYHFTAENKQGSIILPSDLKYEYEVQSYNVEEKDRERLEQYQIIYHNQKMNFKDKLMLLSPKYESAVTSVVFDLFSKEELKEYFKGKFKNIEKINDLIPQIDEFLRKRKERSLEELVKLNDEYNRKKEDFENNYNDLENKRETAIKELKKIANEDMNIHKTKINENKHSLQDIKMMKWILTLVYHKSVNSIIHNSSLKGSDLNRDIDERELHKNPIYPHYKIAILTNNKPNFIFKLNIHSNTSSLKLSDSRINLYGKEIGIDKYMCLFVLPLSTYEVNVTGFDGDIVYEYYPLKFNMKDSTETDIYNSMIYLCKNNNIKYEIKDDSITKSTFIGKLFEKLPKLERKVDSQKYTLYYNTENCKLSPKVMGKSESNRVLYIPRNCSEITTLNINDDVIDTYINSTKSERDVKDYFHIDDKGYYHSYDDLCNKKVDEINSYINKINDYKYEKERVEKIKTDQNEKTEIIKNMTSTYASKIFIPKIVEYSENFNVQKVCISNVIIITSIKNCEIILPENKTYFLPEHIKSHHEPEISIPILNPSHQIVAIEEVNCKAALSADKLTLKFNNMEEGKYRYMVKMKVLNHEDTINFVFSIKANDDVYFTNYPCYISPENPKELCYFASGYCPKEFIIAQYSSNISVRKNHPFKDINPITIPNTSLSVKYINIPPSGDIIETSTEFYIKNDEWKRYKLVSLVNELVNIPEKVINTETKEKNLKSNELKDYINGLQDAFLVGLSANHSDSKSLFILKAIKYLYDHKDVYIDSINQIVDVNMKYLSSLTPELVWKKYNPIIEENNSPITDFDNSMERNAPGTLTSISIGISNGELNENGNKGIKLCSNIHDDGLEKVVGVYIDQVTALKLKHDAKEEDENKSEDLEEQAEQQKSEIRTANVKDILQHFKEYPLDIYFEALLTRINDDDACNVMSLRKESILPILPEYGSVNTDKLKPIYNVISDFAFQTANEIRNFKTKEDPKRYTKIITIVIDTSFTHKKYKARLRSLVASFILVIADELKIPTRIIAALSHGQATQISHKNDNLMTKISEIFDLESIEKMPSTPLDIFAYSDTIKYTYEKDYTYFIISDGFSEQLMSNCVGIEQVLKSVMPSLILIHILAKDKNEKLSTNNLKKMKMNLSKNFPDTHYIEISDIDDFSHKDIITHIYPLFYSTRSKESISDLSIHFIKPSDKSSFDIVHPTVLDDNITVIIDNTRFSGKSEELPVISDKDLDYFVHDGNNTLARYLNEKIKGNQLFYPLSSTILIPNKPTTWIPSVSGTSIHFQNFIKFLLTKSGDGKIFKKKTGNKVRSYSVSLVLDASDVTMSTMNVSHTLETFFTLLRGICELNVPTIDIWVATDKIFKIGTGLSVTDAWSASVASSIYAVVEYVRKSNVSNTVLFDTLKYAYATCISRPYTPVTFVFTNHLTLDETRLKLKLLIQSSNCKTIGIGVGYSLFDVRSVFPTFLWASNPSQLYRAVAFSHHESLNPHYRSDITFMKYNENDKYSHVNEVFKIFNKEFVKSITEIYSAYEFRALFINALQTRDENINMLTADCTSSEFDLGVDGAFKDFHVLFIILYECRNIKGMDGKIIDKDITREILEIGVNGESPIKKLQTKGFQVQIVYDYYSAIIELATGKYRTVIITCSDGTGYYPVNNLTYPCSELFYLTPFINCLKQFYEKGGGIFWMLENYPFSYEANVFFKEVFGINNLTKDKYIKGGRKMSRATNPEPGKFRTVGQDMFQYNIDSLRIDTGLKYIYEGKTLAALNEEQLKAKDFIIFARESQGNASIMLKEREKGYGKIVIDTASSKLFLEFTDEGTSRWISNAVVWLLNIDTYFSANKFIGEFPTTIPMTIDTVNIIPDMRITAAISYDHESKPINFCLTIILDCTDSMQRYIDSTRDIIKDIYDDISSIKRSSQINKESDICGMFIGYKDFDVKEPYYCSNVTDNFDEIKFCLSNAIASGGEDYNEDISGGVELALKHIEKKQGYKHLILIVGDQPNHGDGPGDKIQYKYKHPYTNETWDEVWKRIGLKLDNLDADVHFLSVYGKYIFKTAERISKFHSKIFMHESKKDLYFSETLKNIISEQYKQYVGIS